MDLVFTCLRDVMQMIDTCLYTGVDKFPREIYDFACINAENMLTEMNELEDERGELVEEYYEFTKTTEYIALRLCCGCYAFSYYYWDKQNKLGMLALLKKAIESNNMPLVRYCIEDLDYCNIDMMSIAVSNGCIRIFEYLLNRYPLWLPSIKWDYRYCMTAAEFGDVTMLAYLHEKVGCIWTETTITLALGENNFDCAIYAIKNGCPISRQSVYYAIVCEKSTEILRCLIEDGNISVDSSYYMNFAMRHGSLEFIKLLYQYGCKPNADTVENAIFGKNKECIQFAIEISEFL
jgi:hypothetical protein